MLSTTARAAALALVAFGSRAVAEESAEREGVRPVRVIFDTDMDSDCDDLGALAVLHALCDLGEAELLAVVTTTGDRWSPSCADAVNTYYGRPDVPIGVLDPARGGREGQSRYTRAVAEACPHDLEAYEDAEDSVRLYRRVLAAQEDRSVAIVTVGHLTSLARLIRSEPDRISPLSGTELVERKVRLWCCMGGRYPSGREPNFSRPDPSSTVGAVERWPGEAVFSGAEIGDPIQTGARLAETPAGNPVRIGYERRLRGPGRNRASWDQTAVIAAVRGARRYWKLHGPGRCEVGPDGSNRWRDSPEGKHSYLEVRVPPEDLARTIEALMIAPPRRKPSGSATRASKNQEE